MKCNPAKVLPLLTLIEMSARNARETMSAAMATGGNAEEATRLSNVSGQNIVGVIEMAKALMHAVSNGPELVIARDPVVGRIGQNGALEP